MNLKKRTVKIFSRNKQHSYYQVYSIKNGISKKKKKSQPDIQLLDPPDKWTKSLPYPLEFYKTVLQYSLDYVKPIFIEIGKTIILALYVTYLGLFWKKISSAQRHLCFRDFVTFRRLWKALMKRKNRMQKLYLKPIN